MNPSVAAETPETVRSSARTIRLAPRNVRPLDSSLDLMGRHSTASATPPSALEESIAQDPAWTTRVLATANSSFYGCTSQIDSLRGAIALLGVAQVQNIARALTTAPTMESDHGASLWAHARACALWTRVISQHLKLPDIPYLFTAGLMHDAGIFLLLDAEPERTHGVIERCRDRQRGLHDEELAAFGIDHAALTARACALWNLPERLARAIAAHHQVDEMDLEGSVLRLADALARAIGLGEFAWTPRDEEAELLAASPLKADVEQLLTYGDRVYAQAVGPHP